VPTALKWWYQELNASGSGSRVAVIGGGAIGGFYGSMLARAGFEVHFLLRSEFEIVAEQGLLVQSTMHGDFHLDEVNIYRSVDAMPQCDWLLLSAKATSNIDLAPLLVRVAATDARILVLQNGLGLEDQLRPFLPASLHLIGGLCWVGVQRDSPGVIEHIALGDVHLGYHSGPESDPQLQRAILEAGVNLFESAGIRAMTTTDLTRSRWHKLVWNIPYNGLSVVLNTGTHGLMGNPNSRHLIREIMHEVLRAAAACGHWLPDDLAEQMLALTDSIPDYMPSMYLDNANLRPMELDVMYAAPLAAARGAGCPMPKVEALYQELRFIDARNALAVASSSQWTLPSGAEALRQQ
jgi:2-dehydropantoate 2-reductase